MRLYLNAYLVKRFQWEVISAKNGETIFLLTFLRILSERIICAKQCLPQP